MSKFEFISSIINSIVWPIVILLITILLRKPLFNILSKLTKVTYNNLEMDFSKKLDELETNLELKELPSDYSQPANDKMEKDITTVARISPAASITMAWSLVEQELMDTIKRLAISPDYPPHNSALKNINLLKNIGLLDSEAENTLTELRILRNQAAHNQVSNEKITYLDAIKYYELSITVIKLLKNLKR